MNYEKLTLEACTHAAQNERLPLRSVVQVLFFEQLQLRHAIAGTLYLTPAHHNTAPSESNVTDYRNEEETERRMKKKRWREAIRENEVLRLDMDSMRTRVQELETECSTMKKVIRNIDKVNSNNNTSHTWRSALTTKFGCKFKTQVCDSHQSTVVDNPKGRHNINQW